MSIEQQMMDMLEPDLPTIECYVRENAYGDIEYESAHEESIDTILHRVWAKEKQGLFQLMGNQLMLHKDVCVKMAGTQLVDDMDALAYSSFGSGIKHQFIDKLAEYRSLVSEDETPAYYSLESFIYRCFASLSLALNEVMPNTSEKVKVKLPDNYLIQVPDKTKPIRFLAKLAKHFDIAEFEEFRLEHSRILNSSKLTGRLTLSIHPFDFMTMSDNDCGWSSCMSWCDHGDYRLGTVEMMNSPFVIEAYLEASEPMRLWNCYFENSLPEGVHKNWNNKKWRCLFLVDAGNDFIVKVKAYPYQHEELENIVLDWIAELVKNHTGKEFLSQDFQLSHDRYGCMGFDYNDVHVAFHFRTDNMYNDFSNHSHSHMRISKNYMQKRIENEENAKNGESYNIDLTRTIKWNYSGYAQCMYCGSVYDDFADESKLVCERECRGLCCCECGEHIDEDNAWYDENGEAYCEYCYGEYFVQDIVTESDIRREYAERVFLIPRVIYEKMQKMITEYKEPAGTNVLVKFFGISREFLRSADLPVVWTDRENLWNPYNTYNTFVDYDEANKAYYEYNNYFITNYERLPEMAYDQYGDRFFFYVFDNEDQNFYHSHLCKDFSTQNYMPRYNPLKQTAGIWDAWQEKWNSTVLRYKGITSYSSDILAEELYIPVPAEEPQVDLYSALKKAMEN